MILSDEVMEIQDQVKKVISFSQDIIDPNVEELIKIWFEAKKDFRDRFDNKWIYEYPEKISFHLSENEKEEYFEKFFNEIKTSSLDYTPDFLLFLQSQKDNFFENTVKKPFLTLKGIQIPTGSKIIRSFKYFIKDRDQLKIYQDKASMLIQEDKLEGKLCLSVHPLDFLSSSETIYNWRSCHSLDGSYRAGNLSYMLDSSTIICYLKGEEKSHLPHFPEDVLWNSKKWRVLLFFSENRKMVFAGRQYPFSRASGLDKIIEILSDLPGFNVKGQGLFSNWIKPKYTYSWEDYTLPLKSGVIPVGDECSRFELKSIQDLIEDVGGTNALHYNDLLYSSCYTPFYSFYKNQNFTKNFISPRTKFKIGYNVPCVKCGKLGIISGADTMMCGDCELAYGTSNNDVFTYCECCGERIYTDNAYWFDDVPYCERCYDEIFSRCDRCGEITYKDCLFYDERTDQDLCESCLEDIQDKNEEY